MQSIIIYIYSYSNLKQVKKNIPPCRIKLRRKSDTFYSNKPPQKRLKKKNHIHQSRHSTLINEIDRKSKHRHSKITPTAPKHLEALQNP